MNYKFIYFLISIFLLGCNQPKESFDQKSIYSTHKDNNSYIIFNDSLPFVYSVQYYQLHASLFENNSSLILHSHFKNFDQGGGIQIKALREKDSLKIFVQTPRYPEKLLFEESAYFEATKNIFITFEVSNDWNEPFINLWTHFINRSGFSKKYYYSLKEQNLLVSSKAEDFPFYSHGEGLNWGVKLNKAHLKSGKRTAVK